jgi:hypothetical protein
MRCYVYATGGYSMPWNEKDKWQTRGEQSLSAPSHDGNHRDKDTGSTDYDARYHGLKLRFPDSSPHGIVTTALQHWQSRPHLDQATPRRRPLSRRVS